MYNGEDMVGMSEQDMQKQDMEQKDEWTCKHCGCESATKQKHCPNDCPKDTVSKVGSFKTIRGHKNWCKEKLNRGECDCGYRQSLPTEQSQ